MRMITNNVLKVLLADEQYKTNTLISDVDIICSIQEITNVCDIVSGIKEYTLFSREMYNKLEKLESIAKARNLEY